MPSGKSMPDKKFFSVVLMLLALAVPELAYSASLFTKASDFSKAEEYGLKFVTYTIEEKDSGEGVKKLGKYDVLWDILGKSEEFFLNGDPDAFPQTKDRILKIKLVLDQTQVLATKLGEGSYDDAAMEAITLAVGLVDHPLVNLVWEMSKLTYESHKAVKESVTALEIEKLYGIVDTDRRLHGTYSEDGPKLIPTDKDTVTYFYDKYIVTNRDTRQLVRTYVNKVIGGNFPEYSPTLWQRISGTAETEKEAAELAELIEFKNASRAWIKQLIDDLNKQVKLNWARMTLRRKLVVFNEFKARYDESIKDFDSIDAFFRHYQKMKSEQKNYASIVKGLQEDYKAALSLLNFKNDKGKRNRAHEARPLFWKVHNSAVVYGARAAKIEDYSYSGIFDKIAADCISRIVECDKIMDEDNRNPRNAAGEKAELQALLTDPKKTPEEIIIEAKNKTRPVTGVNPDLIDSQKQGMIEYYSYRASAAKKEFEEYQAAVEKILSSIKGKHVWVDLFSKKRMSAPADPLSDMEKVLSEYSYVSAGPLSDEDRKNNVRYSVINAFSRKKIILNDSLNNFKYAFSQARQGDIRVYLERLECARQAWNRLEKPDAETMDFIVSGRPERDLQAFNENISVLESFFKSFKYSRQIEKLDRLEDRYNTEIDNRRTDIVFFDYLYYEASEWFNNQCVFDPIMPGSIDNGILRTSYNPYNSKCSRAPLFVLIEKGPYAGYLRKNLEYCDPAQNVRYINSGLSSLISKTEFENMAERKKDLETLNASKFWKQVKNDMPESAAVISGAYGGAHFKFMSKKNLYKPEKDFLPNSYFKDWKNEVWLADEAALDGIIQEIQSIKADDEESYKNGLSAINKVMPGTIYFPDKELLEKLPFTQESKENYFNLGVYNFSSTSSVSDSPLVKKYEKIKDIVLDKYYERNNCFRNGSCRLAQIMKEKEQKKKQAEQQATAAVPQPSPYEPSETDRKIIEEFYAKFKTAYEAQQENVLLGYISDDWDCGDGTTLQDLEDNFRNMFTLYDALKYEISGLQIKADREAGIFDVSYRLKITGSSFSMDIRREEESSVRELILVKGNSVKIKRTLNGFFWYRN